MDNTCESVQLTIVRDSELPDTGEEDDCSSYADLNMIYGDLYNFKMCEFCHMPTADDFCSEACKEMFHSEDSSYTFP